MKHFLSIIVLHFLGLNMVIGQKPEPPEVTRLTIDPETQRISIFWNPSPTPGVTSYEVYEWRYVGDNPMPSGRAINGTSTTGLQSTFEYGGIDTTSYGFYVQAFIDDEGSNIPSIKDSTILLQYEYDSCASFLQLEWNDYNRWRGNIVGYRIIRYTESGITDTIGALSSTTNDLEMTGIIANQDYTYYVEAIKTGGAPDDVVASNKINFNTDHSQHPEYIYANYATLEAGNSPQLKFTIDPNSELVNYALWRSESDDTFTDSITTFVIDDPTEPILYTDNEVDAGKNPYFYQLRALNYCNAYSTNSNVAGTINLKTEQDYYDVNLNWNNYKTWATGVNYYEVQRQFKGRDWETLASSPDILKFTDTSIEELRNAEEKYPSEVCFRIVAVENTGNPYGMGNAESTSNTSCIYLPLTDLFNENAAFVPEKGASFGPSKMEFIPEKVEFKIYNRLGNLVYKSSDPYNLRWDGKHNSAIVPEGIYRYQFKYKNGNEPEVIIHGKVTVVSR